MRHLGLLILGLVGCVVLAPARGHAEEPVPDPGPAAKADAAPPLVTLRDAARAGRLEVVGRRPASYKQVELHLRNPSDEPLRIDVAGSHLVRKTGGPCQRLGLGPVVTPRPVDLPRAPRAASEPPGTAIVQLAAGEARVVLVNTCCLDAGKPCPRGQTFRAAATKLPRVREKVLRWWADNPHAPQSAVNTAIWQNRDEVVVPEAKDPVAAASPVGIAAHAGTLYMLRTGELLARDPDGIERFLGTEIHAVHPTSGAVYAEARGAPAGRRGVGRRELWRLVPTGEVPWRLVAPIPENLAIHQLLVAPDGTILVIANIGLYRVDPTLQQFQELHATGQSANLSVRFERSGRMLVTARRPGEEGHAQGGVIKGQKMPVCELWAYDLASGKRDLLKSYWNVRQILGGPAGVYALTPAGKLRRLVGRAFKNVPGQRAFESIVRVGRTSVWMLTDQGRIVAVDRVGRQRFSPGPSVGSVLGWGADAATDAFVYLGTDGFHRVDALTGLSEQLAPAVGGR